MKEREELTRPSPDAGGKSRSGSDAHRVFLLECRLEQMRASVDEARAEAHRVRSLLAEATAREADHARRHQRLHEELAAAREEVGMLHRRLEHSEALRAGLEGRLFESATPEDARELVHLRGEVAAHRDLTASRQRMVTELWARVEELVTSRQTLLSRVAEWQCAAREGNADAIDLAEFIAALSHDILELEHRSVMAERREAELREKLLEASGHADSRSSVVSDARTAESGVQAAESGAPPSASGATVDEAEANAEPADPRSRIDTLLRLGRSGQAASLDAIRSALATPEPGVRAAAYQALGHLLEHDPSRLEPHIRRGIADSDARVRRRVVIAAAAARGLSLRPLLDPLRHDPDPQVRRVVQEVLRRTVAAPDETADANVSAPEEIRAGVAS
jgi:chromosome segregation ATPase